MAQVTEQNVFVVDDEPQVLQAIGETLRDLGVEVTCFANPARCLKQVRAQKCDLVITDLKMPGMDGIELLKKVKHAAPWVPVLILTGYADIPTATAAIKAGAEDFMEKPFVKVDLLQRVRSILNEHSLLDSRVDQPLTKMETKVLGLIVDGRSNKEIANVLNRSIRTIEVHRAHMMHKLGVENLTDLIKRAVTMGLVHPPERGSIAAAQ